MELKVALQNRGIEVVESMAEAPVTLQILREGTSRSLGAISFNTNTRRYTLIYMVAFQLKDSAGEVLVGQLRVRTNRNLVIDANQVLGSTNEELVLEQEMRRELIQKIFYRLSAVDVLQALQVTEDR